MSQYKDMTRQELLDEQAVLLKRFEEYKAMGLNLDMSRGKPNKAQLDLGDGILDIVNSSSEIQYKKQDLLHSDSQQTPRY